MIQKTSFPWLLTSYLTTRPFSLELISLCPRSKRNIYEKKVSGGTGPSEIGEKGGSAIFLIVLGLIS